MAQFRRQVSIARLAGAVFAASLVFALPLPWQAALPLAIGVLVPIFITGITAAELFLTAVILFILSGLLVGPVQTRGHRSHRAGGVAGTAGTPAPIAPPGTR